MSNEDILCQIENEIIEGNIKQIDCIFVTEDVTSDTLTLS
jgi:hypothetical protein